MADGEIGTSGAALLGAILEDGPERSSAEVVLASEALASTKLQRPSVGSFDDPARWRTECCSRLQTGLWAIRTLRQHAGAAQVERLDRAEGWLRQEYRIPVELQLPANTADEMRFARRVVGLDRRPAEGV